MSAKRRMTTVDPKGVDLSVRSGPLTLANPVLTAAGTVCSWPPILVDRRMLNAVKKVVRRRPQVEAPPFPVIWSEFQ